MSDIALRVENLGKQYRIGMAVTRYTTLREAVSEKFNASMQRLRCAEAAIHPTRFGRCAIFRLRCVKGRCWGSSAATAPAKAPC